MFFLRIYIKFRIQHKKKFAFIFCVLNSIRVQINQKMVNIYSQEIYFQQDHHSVFTILSNFQISKREFTSGKICALLFISLKYGAWQQFFSCNPGKNQRDKVKESRKNEENEKALICFSVMFSCHNVFSGTIVFFKTIDHLIDRKRSIRTSILILF